MSAPVLTPEKQPDGCLISAFKFVVALVAMSVAASAVVIVWFVFYAATHGGVPVLIDGARHTIELPKESR